jgi:hypothetical protein
MNTKFLSVTVAYFSITWSQYCPLFVITLYISYILPRQMYFFFTFQLLISASVPAPVCATSPSILTLVSVRYSVAANFYYGCEFK